MKLLLLHNRYQLAGGEDRVVQAEKRLLEANGHEVLLLEENNQSIIGSWGNFVAARSAIYSFASRQKVGAAIETFSPDIVHVHNFFPLLSPAIYDACNNAGVPILQTLHNYRLICPKAMLFRDGKICENCVGKVPLPSIIHGCYRNSHLQTSAVAAMIFFHWLRGTWQERVNAYISLTNFQKDKMVQAGLPAEKIFIKPNFVFSPRYTNEKNKSNSYLLFVGRLSEEKGIKTLIDTYIKYDLSIPLKIVGDGPLRYNLQQKVRNTKADNFVKFLGFQDNEAVLKLMQNAICLVFPSIWYEAFPLTIAEAFASGLPVLASNIGSMAEIIEDGVTGLHFKMGDSTSLVEKIKWVSNHPEIMISMGKNASNVYNLKYTPKINYQQLIKIYQQVIKNNRSR
ncbi:MAG: glycosyltransferase [Rivularia sp. (in: Bacteria)]|nr:glycosyltransferase [Rivularia sp. MS3]